MNFKICAIIVTYNIKHDILKCVNSVINQVDEIIIIDNGSEKETILILQQLAVKEKITIVYCDENKGIASALNIGIDFAKKKKYEWALTLDHDSEPTPTMIAKMFQFYSTLSNSQREKVGMLAPSYCEKAFLSDYSFNESVIDSKEVLTIMTSGNLIRLDVFDIVGNYKEKLFIDSVDHEFCLRLASCGFKIILVSNAILLHSWGTPQKVHLLSMICTVSNHSYLRRYYIARNRIYVWKKYYRLFPKWVYQDIVAFNKENIKLLLFEKQKRQKILYTLAGITDFFRGRYGKRY